MDQCAKTQNSDFETSTATWNEKAWVYCLFEETPATIYPTFKAFQQCACPVCHDDKCIGDSQKSFLAIWLLFKNKI